MTRTPWITPTLVRKPVNQTLFQDNDTIES